MGNSPGASDKDQKDPCNQANLPQSTGTDLPDKYHRPRCIPWPFQPGRTELGLDQGISSQVTGLDYLRTLAISRIFLDNFDNLQSSWVTQGPKVGQMALYYGANDMGSTMLEENVVRAAGTVHCLSEEEIRQIITNSGFKPQRRNMRYEKVN